MSSLYSVEISVHVHTLQFFVKTYKEATLRREEEGLSGPDSNSNFDKTFTKSVSCMVWENCIFILQELFHSMFRIIQLHVPIDMSLFLSSPGPKPLAPKSQTQNQGALG